MKLSIHKFHENMLNNQEKLEIIWNIESIKLAIKENWIYFNKYLLKLLIIMIITKHMYIVLMNYLKVSNCIYPQLSAVGAITYKFFKEF